MNGIWIESFGCYFISRIHLIRSLMFDVTRGINFRQSSAQIVTNIHEFIHIYNEIDLYEWTGLINSLAWFIYRIMQDRGFK